MPTIAELFDDNALEHLHTIELIGERASEALITKLKAKTGTVRNTYGPTECTSMVCASADFREPSHIGSGVGAVTWVVDPHSGDLSPMGGLGELWLEGPLVGRGCINNTDRSSTVFVNDPPFLLKGVPGHHPGRRGRLYRTGDLVRYEEDGTLTYLGRQDAQVKINGQRVELGEVEHHVRLLLGQDTRIIADVVTPIDTGKPTLVVFVVPNGAEAMSLEELHDAVAAQPTGLNEKLSDSGTLLPCMVPSAFIPLHFIPQTATGKTDRRCLRERGTNMTLRATDSQEKDVIVEPSTQPERTLRKAWAEIFHIPEASISVASSFVRLGGDSVTAMRLAAVAQHGGLSLTVSSILSHPRLTDMASLAHPVSDNPDRDDHEHPATQIQWPKHWAHRSAWLKQDNIESIAHVFDSQIWMLAVGSLDGRGFHMTYRVTSKNGLDAERLVQACRLAVRQQPILRTIFVEHNGHMLQAVLRHTPSEQVFLNPTSTMEYPSLREARALPQFHILVSGSQEVCLEVRIHHALYDAFSTATILEDISGAYAGQAIARRPDYHSWISHVRGLDTTGATDFWTQALRGSSVTSLTAIEPPTRYAVEESSLEFAVSARSLQVDGVTPANVFKAAWAIVLSQAVKSSDVVFGEVQTVHSSSFPSIRRTCGPSLDVLPVRAKLKSLETCSELAANIQAQSLEATPHHHLGIRSIIKNCTDWSAWTRFSSIVIFQNHRALQADHDIGGVSCQLEQISYNGDSADVWVVAMPVADRIIFRVMFLPERVPHSQANWLVQRLQIVLEAFVNQASLEEVQVMTQNLHDYKVPPQMRDIERDRISESGTIVSQRKDLVRRAWANVGLAYTNPRHVSPDMLGGEDEHEPFWSRSGGDLVSAYLLSERYQADGFPVSTLDIVTHPSQTGQAHLLSNIGITSDDKDASKRPRDPLKGF